MLTHPTFPNCKQRSAYTLFELMIVCMVLAVAAAIAIPSTMGWLGSSQIDEAKEAVQAGLSKARTQAIRQGRPCSFQVRNNSNEFRIIVQEDPLVPTADPQEQNMPISEQNALPKQIAFDCCPSGAAAEQSEGGWMPVAIFQPDGTTVEDVQIRLLSTVSPNVLIHLRGATGSVDSVTFEGEQEQAF